MEHRLHLVWMGTVLKSGIFSLSVYHKDDENDANLALLEAAAVCRNVFSGPWIMVGYWNVTHQAFEASNWLKVANGLCTPLRSARATPAPMITSWCTKECLPPCGAETKTRSWWLLSAMPVQASDQGQRQQIPCA